MVVYNRMKFELVAESFVIQNFNQGTLSPLIVFAKRASDRNFRTNIFLQYKDRINTKYVIISSFWAILRASGTGNALYIEASEESWWF